jgi:peroxiredoxin
VSPELTERIVLPSPEQRDADVGVSERPSSIGRQGSPWLGIEMRVTERGVVVDDVVPSSPAELAGLKSGDLLISIADTSIAEPADVHAALRGHEVGEDVACRIARGKQEERLTLRLAARPNSTELLRSLFVGKPAPSISSLRTVTGSVVPSLVQLRGKVVVLEFWATWCVACRAMSPTMNHWFDTLSPQGLRVLAVSSEPYEEVSLQLPSLQIRYPVFVDESTEVSQGYHAGAIPTLFLIDAQGVVREVEVGFSPEGLASFESALKRLLGDHLE